MKTIGILGGVGPETTAKLYLALTKIIRERGETRYPPIVIYNLPFPFHIEEEAIGRGINAEKMIPYLKDGVQILEKAGADFGILPCNTLHAFIEDIRSSTAIPFLSILEETALNLQGRNIRKVCLLASQSTVQSNIYEHALKHSGIEIGYPTQSEQHSINALIVELLHGEKGPTQIKRFEDVCETLSLRGVDTIVLACTDLQLIASHAKSRVLVIDTTEILIQASIREMLYEQSI